MKRFVGTKISTRYELIYVIMKKVMMPRFPATRLGKLMRANTVEKILELCEEFVPGEVRPQRTADPGPADGMC